MKENHGSTGVRLPQAFLDQMHALETSYLQHDDPIRQSGFGGGPERWRRERGAILEAIERDGDLLDVGCANGYLLECLVRWAAEKGIALVPYGVDLGARLILLARERLPRYADHFWVGNAWEWTPPRRFTYVYTLVDLVPGGLLCDYLRRTFAHFVAPGGRLIVGAYGSGSEGVPAPDVARLLAGCGLPVCGAATSDDLPVVHVAWADRVDGHGG